MGQILPLFFRQKEYNHKYHPEPEIPWPTDPIERSKCPRVKLVYDNGFEFTADGYQGYKELIYVENNYDEKLNRLFLENKKYSMIGQKNLVIQ